MTNAKRTKELREKLDTELEFDDRELRRELFDLRFKASAEQLANPSRIREIRRDIARIATILNERRSGTRGAAPRT